MHKYADYKLRLATESDLPVLLKWRNSIEIQETAENDSPVTRAEHALWFAEITNSNSTELIYEYNGTPIGQLNISRLDLKNSTAYWGYSRGENIAPRGSGTIMEYLALEYAFDKLLLRKLCGELFLFNERVQKVHRKFGWRQEGVLRKHRLKNGVHHDVLCIALFSEDWNRMKEAMGRKLFEDWIWAS